MGAAESKTLRRVLEATIKGACRLPGQSDLRAHGTTEHSGLDGRHHPSFILNGWRRQAGPWVSDLDLHRSPNLTSC